MKTRQLLFAILFIMSSVSFAQAPETGRWQDFGVSSEEVNHQTASRYHEQLRELAHAGQLDTDRALLKRVHRISAGLIRAARQLRPDSLTWHWEMHVTNQPDTEAFCMAGGKILIGSRFVRNLHLSDGELATLLGHEMAHAIAEHHREELSEALHIQPQKNLPVDVLIERVDTDLSVRIKLAWLSYMQEEEADQIGMVLAHLSGWPAKDMLGFYRKLEANSPRILISSSYPAPHTRTSMAEAYQRLWDGQNKQPTPSPIKHP